MVKMENDCVGPCPMGCINCGRKHSPHFYCDECKEEFLPEELYDCDDEMLCENCLPTRFQTIARTYYGM